MIGEMHCTRDEYIRHPSESWDLGRWVSTS